MFDASLFTPFAILFAAGLGGLLLCARSQALSRIDRFALFVIWGPLLVALVSLVLADLGAYSHLRVASLVFAWLVAGAGVHLCHGKSQRHRVPPVPFHERRPLKLLLCLLPLVAVLMGRPYEYLRGGWDPGEYIAIAGHIERSGSLAVQDDYVAGLQRDVRRALMHNPEEPRRTLQPGMLVTDAASGRLMPDYYHLFPSWMALFAGTGDSTFIYHGQHVIAVYAWLIVALAAWCLFGPWPALLVALLLALSPSQIYFSRFPSSEMLTQFCLFSSFYCLCRSLRNPSLSMDITAAAALGASFAAHSTSILPAAGILLVVLLYALRSRTVAVYRLFSLLLLGLAVAGLRNVLVAPHVTAFVFNIIRNDPSKLFPLLVVVAALFGVLAWWSRARFNTQPGAGSGLGRRWLPANCITLAVLFAYFARPHILPGPDAENMALVGLLVSPLGLIAFCLFFYRERWTQWPVHQVAFIMPALLTTCFLLVNKLVQPLYMWAVRRYTALLVPFVLILACVALCTWMASGDRKRKSIAWLSFGSIAGYLAYQSLPALGVTEYAGLPRFMDRLNGHLGRADVVLCEHWKYSTPLRYAYGLPAYQFSRQPDDVDLEEAQAIMTWLANETGSGQTCFYIGQNGRFFHPAFDVTPVAYEESISPRLKRRRSSLPRTVEHDRERAGIFRLHKLPPDYTRPQGLYELEVGYPALGLAGGFHGLSRSDDVLYRWTDGNGAVYVPSYGAACSTRYELRLSSGRPATFPDPAPVAVYLGDRSIAKLEIGAAWETHTIVVDADEYLEATMTMRLESATWDPAAHGITGYPTNLGVRLDWIKISALP